MAATSVLRLRQAAAIIAIVAALLTFSMAVRGAAQGEDAEPAVQQRAGDTPAPGQSAVYLPAVTQHNSATEAGTPVPHSARPSFAEEVYVPAGSFQMGCDSSNPAETCDGPDEQPLHTVNLDAYFIDKYEVTNARYKACVDAGDCTAPGFIRSATRFSYYGDDRYADHPVLNVSWNQAQAFCTWAGRRLPTEAEWEKAARGSSDTRKYPWGNSNPDCTKANFGTVSTGSCLADTNRVGSYSSGASPYGAMDMAGNVFEWVNDWHQSNYYSVSPESNPLGPATGENRVMRGGSWINIPSVIRAATRANTLPGHWYYTLGFRCVRSASAATVTPTATVVPPTSTATPNPTLTEVPFGSVYGQVRLDDKGTGLNGVELQLVGLGKTYKATTNSEGRYRFDVPPGNYVVSPVKPFFEPGSQEVSVYASAGASADFYRKNATPLGR